MTKKEFIKELRRELSVLPFALPFDEQEEAVSYYEEYIEEAADEAAAIAGLGSPKALAKTIKLDTVVSPTARPPQTAKEGVSKIWIVIAGIFAAPLALPLAITFLALILSMLVAVGALIFAMNLGAFAVTVAGLFTILATLAMFPVGLPTVLFFAGMGLVTLALGLLWCKCMWHMSKSVTIVVLRMLAGLLRKLTRKQVEVA